MKKVLAIFPRRIIYFERGQELYQKPREGENTMRLELEWKKAHIQNLIHGTEKTQRIFDEIDHGVCLCLDFPEKHHEITKRWEREVELDAQRAEIAMAQVDFIETSEDNSMYEVQLKNGNVLRFRTTRVIIVDMKKKIFFIG
jgi:hypothetical protein